MPLLTIIANIYVKKEFQSQVKKELLKLVEITRNEKGCLHYQLHQDNDDELHFMFYETWETKDLLQQHLSSNHMKSYIKATNNMISSLQITKMKKI
ncbi:antibiotic biosynthesis monooxygenase [Francisella halioticida]|uniref:Antibiotic biosynthesis monooxygenase n=1 Tax=Francisella halioticida TaxID=549298 RepID=A0ABM6M1P1_9GAMM|nr:putative quinol monooxygenase [Francisella halioticida]ASG68942.1 antibiotic biosynthesis monooxygenase [Francisella halioticida]